MKMKLLRAGLWALCFFHGPAFADPLDAVGRPALPAPSLSTPIPSGRIEISTQAGQSAPTVLELFTSQGCSSCPPAESILNTWGLDLFEKGKLIPLAFHVDYWDNLGWKDPFDSPLFTGRQQAYQFTLNNSSIYTPQMVVGGTREVAGANSQEAQYQAGLASQAPSLTGLRLRILKQGNILHLAVQISGLPYQDRHWQLMAAVFENGLKTHVAKGENAGADLPEDFVVRSFTENAITGAGDPLFQNLDLPWDPSWNGMHAGVAVFLQNGASLQIDSSAAVYPVLLAPEPPTPIPTASPTPIPEAPDRQETREPTRFFPKGA